MTTRPLTDRERADILARALEKVLRHKFAEGFNGPAIILFYEDIQQVRRAFRRAGYDEKGRRV